MTAVFFILMFFSALVFANPLGDKATEAKGPGRCAYCDEHTARIDERDIETNPSALTLLHIAQSSESEAELQKKTKSSKGVQ